MKRDTLYFRVSLIWLAVVLGCFVFVVLQTGTPRAATKSEPTTRASYITADPAPAREPDASDSSP
jgi:hypothetical protein